MWNRTCPTFRPRVTSDLQCALSNLFSLLPPSLPLKTRPNFERGLSMHLSVRRQSVARVYEYSEGPLAVTKGKRTITQEYLHLVRSSFREPLDEQRIIRARCIGNIIDCATPKWLCRVAHAITINIPFDAFSRSLKLSFAVFLFFQGAGFTSSSFGSSSTPATPANWGRNWRVTSSSCSSSRTSCSDPCRVLTGRWSSCQPCPYSVSTRCRRKERFTSLECSLQFWPRHVVLWHLTRLLVFITRIEF